MMWEQQGVLARLGTSEEAAKVRAKMQSLSLVSDMQAFKVGHMTVTRFATLFFFDGATPPGAQTQAANPGSLLEDFVRWYSPRDWEEEKEEEEEGEEVKGSRNGAEPSPKSSGQSSQQGNQLSYVATSERLGDWGDEGEDWDVILGKDQSTGEAVQSASEGQRGGEELTGGQQATSKGVPGTATSKRVSVNKRLRIPSELVIA